MWAYKTTYRTIVNPNIKRDVYKPRPLTMRDYITVERLSLQGEWRILDMLSDDSIRAVLKVHKAVTDAAVAQKRAPHKV